MEHGDNGHERLRMVVSRLVLTPRPVAGSLEELLDGATERAGFHTTDSKSGAAFERVVKGGERFVLKRLHVDDDWIMRSSGDVLGRPLLVWSSGLLDALPASLDHAVVGAAAGFGRNGWGAALLLRDVSEHLVPPGDAPLSLVQHRGLLDHLAELSATFWGWRDEIGLTPYSTRWAWFGPGMVAAEEALGWPDPVPAIARDGWWRFAERAPGDVARAVHDLRHDLDPLVAALRRTPSTLLHGDWKLGNLGTGPDGRTILLDWAGPGEGPVVHELGWYLAINRQRLPEPKEDAIAAFRNGLEHHGVSPGEWWDRQLALGLLGTVVQFGWEKALGDREELGWWCDRAREGVRYL
jgi:hypothetical protein